MRFKDRFKGNFYKERLKAFLVDMFMINMPILYIMTYVVMGDKNSFQQSPIAILSSTLLYGVIYSLFISLSSQSPGYRYVGLKVIKQNGERVGFFRAFVRYMMWLFGTTVFIGTLLGIWREDKLALHDLLAQTKIIKVDNEA